MECDPSVSRGLFLPSCGVGMRPLSLEGVMLILAGDVMLSSFEGVKLPFRAS